MHLRHVPHIFRMWRNDRVLSLGDREKQVYRHGKRMYMPRLLGAGDDETKAYVLLHKGKRKRSDVTLIFIIDFLSRAATSYLVFSLWFVIEIIYTPTLIL